MGYAFSKRLFDIICSAFGLFILLPAGVLIGLLIKLSDRGPIFYRQIRVGQFGKPFRMWKFRSMVINADKIGALVTKEEDPRITWIGRLLRKTKLDELPQLWNVLVGDMTFVGPRPEVQRYVDLYSADQRKILRYKPGITDVATLLFRNEESLLRGTGDLEAFYVRYCLPKKINLNCQYAKRASFVHDIWIILQTLCPYWLGVLAIYGIALVGSFWLAYELRSDFQMSRQEYEEFRRCLPWMVVPQLVLLFWRGQFRALMSYFSIPEMRRTAIALAGAFALQVGVCYLSQGHRAPKLSIFLIDLILSFFALCAVRMTFRLLRERASKTQLVCGAQTWRVAIIGAGELATNLALDFTNDRNAGRRVVAFFDDNPHTWHKRPHDIPIVGMPECLLNPEWLNKIDEVIVALPEENPARVREIRELLKGLPLKVSLASGWPMRILVSNDC